MTLDELKKDIIKQFQDNEHRMSFDDASLLGKLDYLFALGKQEGLRLAEEELELVTCETKQPHACTTQDTVSLCKTAIRRLSNEKK